MKRQTVTKVGVQWHKDVMTTIARRVSEAGHTLSETERRIIGRRLDRLCGFLCAHFGETYRIPFERAPFDPHDASALILWPRWKAKRLSRRLFLSVIGAPSVEVIDMGTERINIDWIDFPDC